MSSAREIELELRRQRLVLRSTDLRVALTRQLQPLAAPLAWADRLHDFGRWLWQHPEWPLGAAVALIVVRPSRALRWATRLWWAWGLFRRARRLLNDG